MSKSNPKYRIVLPIPGPHPDRRHPYYHSSPRSLNAWGLVLGGVRDWIIKTFQPQHQNIYAFWVTWAYGFRKNDETPDYPKGLCEVMIRGLYRDENCDVLIVQVSELGEVEGVGRQPIRIFQECPDGTPLHITLSCREGFKSAEAHRAIDLDKVIWLDGKYRPFLQNFRNIPAYRDWPTTNSRS